jgi:hypothetical protein
MKRKSAAGIVCHVTNTPKPTESYKALGFTFKRTRLAHATGYINWLWIGFLQSDREGKPGFEQEANARNGGAGQFLDLSVDDSMRPTRASPPKASTRQATGRGETVSSLSAIPTTTSS